MDWEKNETEKHTNIWTAVISQIRFRIFRYPNNISLRGFILARSQSIYLSYNQVPIGVVSRAEIARPQRPSLLGCFPASYSYLVFSPFAEECNRKLASIIPTLIHNIVNSLKSYYRRTWDGKIDRYDFHFKIDLIRYRRIMKYIVV